MGVFNASNNLKQTENLGQHYTHREYEYVNEPELPVISDEVFRGKLAGYYEEYIHKSNLFDFASLPWEIFERNFIPPSVKRSTDVKNAFFKRYDTKENDKYELGTIMKRIRNKKAHGHLSFPKNPADVERSRIACLLLFQIFLDWISGEVIEEGLPLSPPDRQKTWDHLRSTLFSLSSDVSESWISPKRLANHRSVDGLSFLIYTAVYIFNYQQFEEHRFGSEKTIVFLNRLCELPWADHDAFVPDRASSKSIEVGPDDDTTTVSEEDEPPSRLIIAFRSMTPQEDEVKELLSPPPERVSINTQEDFQSHNPICMAHAHYSSFSKAQDAYENSNEEVTYEGKSFQVLAPR